MEIFESLLEVLRTACAGFGDCRRSAAVEYTMADIGLSAFSLFFMQSEESAKKSGVGQGTTF